MILSNKKIIISLLVIIFATLDFINPALAQKLQIVPFPAKISEQPGNFEILRNTTIFIKNTTPEQIKLAASITVKVKNSSGFELSTVTTLPDENVISIVIDSSQNIASEGYQLNVSPKSIQILSKTSAGAFYGIQTLFQLLPPEIESLTIKPVKWLVPCVMIKDSPRFTWRGLHIDVCRHFFSVEVIKKQLNIMAMYKLNTFHWHLTDDQGWRIEIKKYPRLTEIGSMRTEPDGSSYGGFYTQEEIKEVVKYAQDRYINVLPEIEMPGHALAALAAYPEYSCTGGPFSVKNIWGVELEAFCPGKEQTYKFLDDIIAEVTTLFPYEYIHIGGDECMKTRWKVCPLCQARKRKEGLKNEKQLQSYFIKRIEKIVHIHGKKLIGWDEILEGGLASSATVMSWRGEKGGIIAAKKRQNVIMTPQRWMYLDHYQGTDKLEPAALRGLVTLEDLYNYEPIPKKLAPDKHKYILGAQVNLWAEYISTPQHLEYMAYPRTLALSEVDWSMQKSRDYSDFMSRMDNQFRRLDLLGVTYHIPIPEGPCNLEAFSDTLNLNFFTSRPMRMVYTTDSSVPTAESAIFGAPLILTQSTLIKIRTILPTGEMSSVRTIRAEKQQLSPALQTPGMPGLSMKRSPGKFYKMENLNAIFSNEDTIISNLNFRFNYKNPCAANISGYIDVPQSAKYYFTTESDELWIDGKLIVSNEGEIKNHSRNDGSIMLMAGKHNLKINFFNNIIGGRPSSINGIKLSYRINGQDLFSPVSAEMLSH